MLRRRVRRDAARLWRPAIKDGAGRRNRRAVALAPAAAEHAMERGRPREDVERVRKEWWSSRPPRRGSRGRRLEKAAGWSEMEA